MDKRELLANIKNVRTATDPLIFEGMEFLKVEEGNGNIELGLEVKETMLNPNGILHGGMTYTLADMCAGIGAYVMGYTVSTIQGTMNYFRPVETGEIYAKNKVKHSGRTTMVSNVDIFNEDDKLIASGVFTLAVLGPAK